MAPAPPLRSRGALLTMARLFGDWKNPNPNPQTTIRQMMLQGLISQTRRSD
jgi:hypothetical protein